MSMPSLTSTDANQPDRGKSSVRTDELLSANSSVATSYSSSPVSGDSWWVALGPIVGGLAVAGLFYAVVLVAKIPALDRYFLGHPVAFAATTLFWVAIAILTVKTIRVRVQRRRVDLLGRDDCLPQAESSDGDDPARPSSRWRQTHDARHVARNWLTSLSRLPQDAQDNLLITRLRELLQRQSNRGSTKHLGDDMRELAGRDADAAHDSLGLVRIIVWAIPMLGFLGTVIGITQTLGGLDFTDGTAAVDRLKSGLYVAFDTTALGLVLSVFAIFLQFPVERAEQALLADVDSRAGELALSVLPADDPADNQASLITQLCDGIRVAVAESLATQAELWRDTIAEAQDAWRTQHSEGAEQFRRLMASSLTPALNEHADRLDVTATSLQSITATFNEALRDHARTWRASLDQTTGEVQSHRRTLITHTEAMTTLAAQQLTHRNEQSSRRTGEIADAKPAVADAKMADAMKTLAMAVDVLAQRLPVQGRRVDGADVGPHDAGNGPQVTGTGTSSTRRAA